VVLGPALGEALDIGALTGASVRVWFVVPKPTVGPVDGREDGTEVGEVVGPSLGPEDGREDGAGIGFALGETDGPVVGHSDGLDDGLDVGALTGVSVRI
jgi:hypothetical protein